MARTFRRQQRMSAMSEINVTPLIDLAFSLLIIFMIATPLLEQTIPLELPIETQSPQVAQDDLESQTISIDLNGQYHWGETAVTGAQLNDLLQRASLQPVPPVLKIRGDGRVPYQRVVDVLDMAKTHNLSKISLDTRAK